LIFLTPLLKFFRNWALESQLFRFFLRFSPQKIVPSFPIPPLLKFTALAPALAIKAPQKESIFESNQGTTTPTIFPFL
jgi:hypothetical protein